MSPALLDGLQNANCIEILILILSKQTSGPHSTVSFILNHSVFLMNFFCRKFPIIFSKHAITSVASIKGVKKKPRKLEYCLASSELSAIILRFDNLPFLFSAT
jgi:hypothetical protein